MTEDATAIVARAYEAFSAGDYEKAASFYHPEGEIVAGNLMGPDKHFVGGPGALMDGVENAHARWESFDVHPTAMQIGSSPDVVLVQTSIVAKAHDLSVLTAWTTWGVVTIQDSLIKSYRVFYTEKEARSAAGFATGE